METQHSGLCVEGGDTFRSLPQPQQHVCQGACLHPSPNPAAQRGPHARVSLTVGTQAGRQWGCLAGVGQRGAGAADPCTLRCGDALPASNVAWGTLEAVCRRASSIPAASPASLPLLP